MRNQLLGNRYRILDRIGEGGMAYVYLALDEKLGRKVAIKVLHEHMEKNADIRKRFQLEAESVSRLEHPNIVKIYDFSGNQSDRLWIVTEVIRGKNLAQYAEKGTNGALHPIIATCIVREILKALTKAHDLGIVHRDIKPENVMVTGDGRVKLMDFGIAKDLGRQNVTQTGTFMGSPSYMSPEQIRGKDVDQRSDLYSLSVLFYEIVTGRLPFVGQSTHEVVMRIVEGSFTEPRFVMPTLTEKLNDTIVKGMSKKPESRIDSARAYGAILDQYLTQSGFNESHIELERYFENRAAFEDRLSKTQILPPTGKSLALRLRESRLQPPAISERGQHRTSQRRSLSPLYSERRSLPRSVGPRRVRPIDPATISLKQDGAPKRGETNRTSQLALSPPQSPTRTKTRGPNTSQIVAPAPKRATAFSHEEKEQTSRGLKTAYSSSPAPVEKTRASVPPPSMVPSGRHARGAIPEPPVPGPALPVRRAPRPHRIARRQSLPPVARPLRIAVIKPSWFNQAIGVAVIGMILSISVWGFWHLQSRLSKIVKAPPQGGSQIVEAERKEDVLSKIQKTKRKNITPTALPPKNEVKPLEKKDPSLASTSFKALRPGRLKLPSPKDFKQEIQPPKIAPSRKQLRPPSETVGITASSSQSNSAQSLTRDRGSETKDRRVSSEAVKTVASLGTDPKPLTGQTQTVPTATAKKQDSAENQESSLKNKGESGRASDKSGSARFKVSSQPASEVFLNGQRMGTTVDATTASAWFPVSSGKQQLELRRKGYATHKMTLDLRPDESLSVPMIDLVPSTSDPTSGSSKINLTLRVNMLPAQVTVRQLESNNTQVFALKSKAKVLELDPGRYVIKVEHNGETREREVNLSTNQGELTFSADFKEAE